MKIAMVFPIAILGVILALGSCSSAPTEPVAGNIVTIKDFAFSPATITVPVGATVTWTNEDSTAHTIVIVSGSEGSVNSPQLETGSNYSHAFKRAGTYAYHCGIHTYMEGTVIVQ